MKKIVLFLVFASFAGFAHAQKIDSIFVNLYTDSLKKGTYNYINVDGRLTNGKYLPLDSTHLIFESNKGTFHGNSLWIDEDFEDAFVQIRIRMKNDTSVFKAFDMYIKTVEDPDNLKTNQQILDEYRKRGKRRRN